MAPDALLGLPQRKLLDKGRFKNRLAPFSHSSPAVVRLTRMDADYSPGLVFHAKRFIYSGISLKVSRNGGGELGQRLRFRFAMEIVSGGLAGEFAQQDKFCTGGRLNISDITFEYISSAFGRHL